MGQVHRLLMRGMDAGWMAVQQDDGSRRNSESSGGLVLGRGSGFISLLRMCDVPFATRLGNPAVMFASAIRRWLTHIDLMYTTQARVWMSNAEYYALRCPCNPMSASRW